MPYILIDSHRYLDSKLGKYSTVVLSVLKFWTAGGKTHKLECIQDLCCGTECEAVTE